MPIIETLYQLTEKDTSNVNGQWKGLQIMAYAVASITSFVATTAFYNLLNGFSMNCVLHTAVQFRDLNPADKTYKEMISNGTNMTIDSLTTYWQQDLACQYCLLVWTISIVGGIILGAFFILNPRGGKGYTHSIFSQPWKMVIPVLVVSLSMAVLTSSASFNAVRGINVFCASFKNYTGNDSCTKEIDVYTLKYHNEIQPINALQKLVKSGSVLSFVAWICSVVLLLVRICLAPDFNLQIINMIPCEKKYPEFQKKKIYSESSHSILPIYPLEGIERLSSDNEEENAEKEDDEKNSENKESANSEQSTDAIKSNEEKPSPPNNNDKDNNTPPSGHNNNVMNNAKTTFFKML